MTILLSRIVPREQMIVVHAPLAEFEWPRTILYYATIIIMMQSNNNLIVG